MSSIMNIVRTALKECDRTQNINDLMKKFLKGEHMGMKVKREELLQVLQYYQKVNVVWVDEHENVVFL